MYYLIDAAERRRRGGTLYFEFQRGPFRGRHWQEDSVYLSADLFDDLRLYDLFIRALPHFDYYYVTEVNAAQFQTLRAMAEEYHSTAWRILEELAPCAERWLESDGVFTICGI